MNASDTSTSSPGEAAGSGPGNPSGAADAGAGSSDPSLHAASPLVARDAISLLTEDHRKAQVLFADFSLLVGSGAPAAEKFAVAREVCGELLIHMAIEEAIFYPQVRQALHEDGLVDQAEQEHDAAKELIRRIGEIDPADAQFDDSMQSLSTEIMNHVEHEETIVFPKMLLAQVDLDGIGASLLEAKNQMRVNLGLAPE